MHVTIEVGIGGWGLLVVGAFVVGVVAEWIGIAEGDDDWQLVMAAAFVGGLIGSEWLGTLAAPGPVWDGIAVGPAAVGGAFLGAITALITTIVTGRTHPEGGAHA